jgi:hypothetical protein
MEFFFRGQDGESFYGMTSFYSFVTPHVFYLQLYHYITLDILGGYRTLPY